MAQYPAFPLWTDAYLGDTGHFSTIEHGAYLLLLMTMWRAGGELPNDDRQLARFARLTPGQWARIKPALMPCFTVHGDRITQGRLTDELDFVRRKRKSQKRNANARWLKNNDKADAMASPWQCQLDAPTPTPTPNKKEPDGSLSETSSDPKPKKARKKRVSYPPDFEACWLEYPTDPNMSKADAFDAWMKLDAADKDALAASIRPFVAYCRAHPDYRPKHMVGFIKSRRFDGFQPSRTLPTDGDERWRKRLLFARQRRVWSTPEWGPRPGAEGCLVPAHLLAPDDGAGWSEFERERA